jgi:hypothetical protein
MDICNISLLITFLLTLLITSTSRSTQMMVRAVPDISIIVAQVYQPPDRDLPGRRQGGGTR